MSKEAFSVSMAMTKKDLIHQYGDLLKEYQEKVRRARDAERQLTEAQRKLNDEALVVAEEASVPGVIDAIGQLRGLITTSLMELGEQLEGQMQRVEAARASAVEALRSEYEARLKLASKEHEWEVRMMQQRVEHMRQRAEELDAKLAEQRAELESSSARVQTIAEKAVEGASMARAYQSVNDLAMEQARRPERAKSTE